MTKGKNKIIKTKRRKLFLASIVLFLVLIVSYVRNESNKKYISVPEIYDYDKHGAHEILNRLRESNFPKIKGLDNDLKPIHCENFTYQSISYVKDYVSKRIENRNILKGI